MSSTGAPSKDVYGIFCGLINEVSAGRVAHWLAMATQGGHQHLHLLYQSTGGFVGDAVFLYDLFRSSPMEISLYASGHVHSAAVTAYLGAGRRVATAHTTFMIHRTTASPQVFTSEQLESTSKNMARDDQRTKAIIEANAASIPTKLWKQFELADVFISGEQAVEYGIATKLGEFAPPAGTHLNDFMTGF